MPERKYSLQRLQVGPLRGIDERWRARPTSATQILDMTWSPRDAWQEAGGWDTITPDYTAEGGGTNAFAATAAITSLHWFASDTRQWLLWESSSGELHLFNGSRAPEIASVFVRDEDGTIFNGSSRKRLFFEMQGVKTLSTAFAGRLYMVNGYAPLVFDGQRAEPPGFSSPPGSPDAAFVNKDSATSDAQLQVAVFPELGVGAADKACSRRYAVTFVNDRGQESPASDASLAEKFTNVSGKRCIVTLRLPIGPSRTVARRVYATQDLLDSDGDPLVTGSYGSYFFHTEITDNVTTVFVDCKPDAALGSGLDEDSLGAFPVGARVIASFKNTMFIADRTHHVRFSAAGKPEVFPPDNVFALADVTSGPVTAMRATKNALVVFRNRAIWLIKGDPVNSYYAQVLTTDTGCNSPRAIAEIPGMGLAFLGSDANVYLLEGALENTGTITRVVRLSTPIPDLIDRVNRSALESASAGVYHRDKELWISVPMDGEVKANKVLVYHYEVGAWSLRGNFPIADMVVTGDHRSYLIFGSHTLTAGKRGVQVYSRGFSDKGGTALQPIYESVDLDLGSVYTAVLPRYVHAYTVGYGGNNLDLNVTVNRSMTSVYDASTTHDGTASLSHPSRSALDASLAVYDTATWGSGTWPEHRPVPIRFDLNVGQYGPCKELRVKFSPAGRRIQLLSFDVEVDASGKRSPLVLSDNHGGGYGR